MPKVFNSFLLYSLLSVPILGASKAHAFQFFDGSIRDRRQTCLDVRGGITADRNPVQAFTCNGTFAQNWEIDGSAVLGLGTAAGVLKCLDVDGGLTADGTPVQMYTCNGTGAQDWVIGADRSLYNLRSRKCLDVGGGAPGTQATIQTCNGSPGQVWVVQ